MIIDYLTNFFNYFGILCIIQVLYLDNYSQELFCQKTNFLVNQISITSCIIFFNYLSSFQSSSDDQPNIKFFYLNFLYQLYIFNQTLFILKVNYKLKNQLLIQSQLLNSTKSQNCISLLIIFAIKSIPPKTDSAKFLHIQKILSQVIYHSKQSSINQMQSNPSSAILNQRLITQYKESQSHVFLYFAKYHPDKLKIKALPTYIKHKINIKNIQKYSLIFFNHQAPQNAFSEFKNIIMFLINEISMEYISKLNQIILVKPKFYQRKISNSLIYGKVNILFNQKFSHFDNCSDLCKYLNFEEQNFIKYLPKSIQSDQYPDLSMKKGISVTKHRVNLLGQQQDSKLNEGKGWIAMLVQSFDQNKVQNIQQYPQNQAGIPILLDVLIMFFKSNPDKLCQQGIFRKSISIDDEEDTLRALRNYDFDFFQQSTDSHIAAVAIKRIFSLLKYPVIPLEIYQEILQVKLKENDPIYSIKSLQKVINKLGDTNFQSLYFLFQFLHNDVMKYSSKNEMSFKNIGICIGPCLMRSQSTQIQKQVAQIFKTNQITQILVRNYKQIFQKQKCESIAIKSAIKLNKSFMGTIQIE